MANDLTETQMASENKNLSQSTDGASSFANTEAYGETDLFPSTHGENPNNSTSAEQPTEIIVNPTEGSPTSQPDISTEKTQIESPTISVIKTADNLPKMGEKLNNKYQIIKELGKGGMGCVYKVIDEQAAGKKTKAIKLLLPALAKDETLVNDFKREVEKAQGLSHKNIIIVHNYECEGDRHFMVMEYLAGQSLKEVIVNQAPIPLNKAWPLIQGMAEGLDHAHKENNIIHRDFKPANVFVLENTLKIKILDFGIAAELNKDGGATIFDSNGGVGSALTTKYASLEMLQAEKKADPRDDIYAFGLVVYELLTGDHPYNGDSAIEVREKQKKNTNYKPPQAPPGLNKKQWELLKQTIEIEQKNRPEDLGKWLAEFNPAHTTPVWQKWLVPAAAALTATAILGFLLWTKPFTLPEPPIANPGKSQQASVGQTVTLDASASLAHDGSPLKYQWQILDKPPHSQGQLAYDNTATPQVQPDRPGDYTLQLTVTDAHQQVSEPKIVLLTVSAPLPVANAGAEQTARVGHSVTLDASQSKTTADGPLSYQWQLLNKPEQSNSTLEQDNSATPKLTPDRPGTYQIQLQVTDSNAQTSAPVTVNVNASNVQFTTQPRYRIGSYFKATATPSEAGYLSIFYVDSTGENFQIYPLVEPSLKLKETSQVSADQKIPRPPAKLPQLLSIGGPEGTDKLIAFFSKKPLPDETGLKQLINKDGAVSGLPPDITAEQTTFQIIKN